MVLLDKTWLNIVQDGYEVRYIILRVSKNKTSNKSFKIR